MNGCGKKTLKTINEVVCRSTKYEKVELKDVKLKKHPMYGYCLDVTYQVDRKEDVVEINIPCVKLPISCDGLTITSENMSFCTVTTADVGFGDQEVFIELGKPAYTIKTIKEKTREMTLEEIEKELGHKVKIVSDKND